MKAICSCTTVIKYDDKCFPRPGNSDRPFFCENCGPNGCNSFCFKALCPCGKILFAWSSMLVCPKTGKNLCFGCGEQKIKDARHINSINRQQHRHFNFKYLEGLDDSLKRVELSGWHLFVRCIINSHKFDSLTHYELIKRL